MYKKLRVLINISTEPYYETLRDADFFTEFEYGGDSLIYGVNEAGKEVIVRDWAMFEVLEK
jgi:hypothetical protein